jgi:hypothetical protein
MDSLIALCTSGPSPGRGLRIESRSVSKPSGKSTSIGGFMSRILAQGTAPGRSFTLARNPRKAVALHDG